MAVSRTPIKSQPRFERVLSLVDVWANGESVNSRDAIWLANQLMILQRDAATPTQRRTWRNEMLCRLRLTIAPELETYPAACAVLQRLKQYRQRTYQRDKAAGGPLAGDPVRYLCFAICELERVPKLRKLQDILAIETAE